MPEQPIKINKNFISPALFIILSAIFTFATAPVSASTAYPRENAVVKAIRRVGPAVVNISSESKAASRTTPFSGFGMNPFFDSFFKDFFEPGFGRQYRRTSLGSGVIIDGARGLILTNEHVISKSGTITVMLQDERQFEAKIVGADPDSDLAVLRIVPDAKLPSIEMGTSDDLMIGESIIAIGNPFGLSHTVTTGVISAVNRTVRTEDRVFQDFIQTDASINPGNSGGPLLNINGELIGINTAIYAKAQGIGFAIPINKARRIVSDLIRYGEVVLPWVGIEVQDLDERIVAYVGLPDAKGILVKSVQKESPAARAGIAEGDVLLSVGTRALLSVQDYRTAVRDHKAGETMKVKVWRRKKEIIVPVKTAVFPLERAADLAFARLGIRVKSRPKPHGGEGVVISQIRKDAYLGQIGARPGDIVRQIDEQVISDLSDFNGAMIKYRHKSSVVLLLQRGDQGYYITVKM